MTVDEFIIFRDVKIKDNDHKRIVQLFYSYLQSVSGDEYLFPSILGKLLGVREVSVAGITDKGFAEQIILNARRSKCDGFEF